MDIDVIHLSKEDRDHYIKEECCFNCSNKGHISRECPNKNKQFSKGTKKVEAKIKEVDFDKEEGTCHACDNQSHPRPKDLPSHLVPLSSCLLQVAEITCTSPLHNSYVIQHHLASPQLNLEHHRPHPNEYSHTRATTVLAQAHVPRTRLLGFSLKSLLLLHRYI